MFIFQKILTHVGQQRHHVLEARIVLLRKKYSYLMFFLKKINRNNKIQYIEKLIPTFVKAHIKKKQNFFQQLLTIDHSKFLGKKTSL